MIVQIKQFTNLFSASPTFHISLIPEVEVKIKILGGGTIL